MNSVSGHARQRKITRLFDELAATYDSPALGFYPFAADRFAAWLRIAPGMRVLDVGAGTGALSIAAAQLLQAQGRVTAIDQSGAMLDRLHLHLSRQGLQNVDVHQMDASDLAFRSNYYDVVAGSFSLYYLEDMAAALRGWGRVCKPGGKLGFVGLAADSLQPMLLDLQQRCEQALAGSGTSLLFEEAWHPLARLRTEDMCHTLLRESGLNPVAIEVVPLRYRLKDAREWWEFVWNSELRMALTALPQAELGRVMREHMAAVEPLVESGGLSLELRLLFASGQVPAE